MTQRDEFLSDIIITAIEGGIGYWSTTLHYQAEGRVIVGQLHANPPEQTRAIIVVNEDGEHGEEFVITPSVIEQGIARLINGEASYPEWAQRRMAQINDTNDGCEIDSDDADHIVQVALLGAIVYA